MFRWETHKEDGLLQREFLYSSLDDAGTKSDDTGLRWSEYPGARVIQDKSATISIAPQNES